MRNIMKRNMIPMTTPNSKATGDRPFQSIASANFHPGAAVWVPALALLVLNLAAFYLFWAKIAAAWPFGG